MSGLDQRLKEMRDAGRRVCRKILDKRNDVIAVYIEGSVARGDIHEKSDVDIIAVKEEGEYEEERRSPIRTLDEVDDSAFSIDIGYIPLGLWKEELYHNIGSEWECEVSTVVDSIVLYDPKRLVAKAKEYFKLYPENRRRMTIKNILDKLKGFSESVWYHYVNKNYDIESLFSKFFAMEALKILFPINRTYLKADKYIFRQLEELKKKPTDYSEKCLSLLWFKSQNVNHDEATWVINMVSETRRAIEDEIHLLGYC